MAETGLVCTMCQEVVEPTERGPHLQGHGIRVSEREMEKFFEQSEVQPYQAKWNVETGAITGVASKAHERGPKEQQASLLMWGEDQRKMAAWNEASRG